MSRAVSIAALALLLAAPLSAQAPEGWQMRVDRSTNASDPDDVPEVTVTTTDDGFQVNTGPAVTMWNPENSATGTYTLSGTFTLLEPSGHTNYYGLVFGGDDLTGAEQSYLYFLVAQNGTFLVKHRAGNETTHDVQGRTPSEAVVEPNAEGTSVNELEVRVGADEIEFAVNGTVVHTQPKTGMAARTDGIWGVRINHQLPGVVVEDLGVSQ
jgi:hypothetical protein